MYVIYYIFVLYLLQSFLKKSPICNAVPPCGDEDTYRHVPLGGPFVKEFDNFVGNSSSTPTGTPVISHIVGLSSANGLFPKLFLCGELALGYQYNKEHQPGNNGFFFEAMLNCTFKIAAGVKADEL